jgi:hypothetical protein
MATASLPVEDVLDELRQMGAVPAHPQNIQEPDRRLSSAATASRRPVTFGRAVHWFLSYEYVELAADAQQLEDVELLQFHRRKRVSRPPDPTQVRIDMAGSVVELTVAGGSSPMRTSGLSLTNSQRI